MASIPCPTRSDRPGCVCDDNPLANLSIEASDGRIWYGHVSVPPIYVPPAGNLTEPVVPIFCISDTSQLEADTCANNGTVPPSTPPEQPQPPTDPNQPPDTPPTQTGDPNSVAPNFGVTPEPSTGFWNTESNCIALCADHSNSATAIIPAHTINGSTQAEADMLASNACIALARANLVCFTPPTEGTVIHLCQDVSASLTCVAAGATSITITGLPPGMGYSCDSNGICPITGSPTVCGNYTVTVSATPVIGNPVSFTFTIMVIGISCPDVTGNRGVPYSMQISACGGTAPYTFSTTSDLANYGLSMNSAGLVTGYPKDTCPVNIPLAVTATDADGNSCTKNCSIHIADTYCCCTDWSTYQDGGSNTDFAGPGATGGTQAVGPSFSATASKPAQGVGETPNHAIVELVKVTYPSGCAPQLCCVAINWSANIPVANTQNKCSYIIKSGDGITFGTLLIQRLNIVATSSGIDYVKVPGSAYIQITVKAGVGPNVPPSLAESASMTVTIVNDTNPLHCP